MSRFIFKLFSGYQPGRGHHAYARRWDVAPAVWKELKELRAQHRRKPLKQPGPHFKRLQIRLALALMGLRYISPWDYGTMNRLQKDLEVKHADKLRFTGDVDP